MKNTELFMLIFRQTHMMRFLCGFGLYYLASCLLIWLLDPSIDTFWNALWFGFMIVTTIGFGDYTVVSWGARIVTMFLGIYGICLFGFVCGVGSSYLFEKIHIGRKESVGQMVWQLEHLETLNEDEISDLKKQLMRRVKK